MIHIITSNTKTYLNCNTLANTYLNLLIRFRIRSLLNIAC
ncbi:hypothetical protein F383_13903 [Gossypium arboreum]|uniref:Uncharacterized protein n=1 Tax=Gossypium arboreum TaxID=29729 RepID=A0A0B0Q3M9_GOSAR|nr:hypothetical protein F383_13903 [Gossypium arboreum]